MFNIVPLAIILISLVVIAYIIIRKFPQLSNIKVETIQKAKEQTTKKKILDERIRRKTQKITSSFLAATQKAQQNLTNKLKNTQEQLEQRKKKMEREELPETLVTKEDFEKREEYIEQELEEAEDLADQDEFEKAEKRYIDIIATDPRNIEAYEGLGDLYFENKMYAEARQTLKYVLKLDDKSSISHYDLAHIALAEENPDEAAEHIDRALELEPRNPKYLDLKIEVAITRKNLPGAQKAYETLSEVNPENKKLEAFAEQIAGLK